MRISASGLLSTIAVAIDQILRLASSIRPVIEPVVSRTKATSTAGFATAAPTPDDSARPARANASERKAGSVGFMILLQCSVPCTEVPGGTRSVRAEIKAWWVRNWGLPGLEYLFGGCRN